MFCRDRVRLARLDHLAKQMVLLQVHSQKSSKTETMKHPNKTANERVLDLGKNKVLVPYVRYQTM